MSDTSSMGAYEIYDPNDEIFSFFSFPDTGEPESPDNRECMKDENFLFPLQNAVPEAVPKLTLTGNVNVAVTEPFQQATEPVVAGESANVHQVSVSQEPSGESANVYQVSASQEPFRQSANVYQVSASQQLANVHQLSASQELFRQSVNVYQVCASQEPSGESANDNQGPESQEPTAAEDTDNAKFLWQRTEKFDNPEDEKRRLNAIKARKNRVVGKQTVTDLKACLKERDELYARSKAEKDNLTMENKMLRTCLNLPQTGRLKLVASRQLSSSANRPERYLALASADGRKIQACYKVYPAFPIKTGNNVIAKPRQIKIQNSVPVASGVLASSGHMLNQAISNGLLMASGSGVVETGPSIVTNLGTQIPVIVSSTLPEFIMQEDQTASNIPTQFVGIVAGDPKVLQALQLK